MPVYLGLWDRATTGDRGPEEGVVIKGRSPVETSQCGQVTSGPAVRLAYENQTKYGDLFVNGSRRLVLRNGNFTIEGSIVARDNATVIIENAIVNMNLTRPGQYNITMWDNTSLTIRDATVRSLNPSYQFFLRLFNKSRAFFSGARFEHSQEWYGSSEVRVENSKVFWVRCCGAVRTNMTRSEVQVMLSAEGTSRVWLTDCRIQMLSAFSSSRVRVVDCQINDKVVCYNDAFVWLVNVSTPKIKVPRFLTDKARVCVSWYLDATVLLGGSPVEGAEVSAYFKDNGTLAASGATGPGGIVRLVLTQAVIVKGNLTEHVGNYTLRASHGQLMSRPLAVTVRGNSAVVLELLATLALRCLDGDGLPVGGVLVLLTKSSSLIAKGEGLTGDDGLALFTALEAGLYEVRAMYMGVEVGRLEGINITAVDVYGYDLPCSIYDLHVAVRGPGGSPVSGAVVSLYFTNGTLVASTLTNSSGVASFENLPATTYKLVVEARGFRRSEKLIELEAEDQVEELVLEALGTGLPSSLAMAMAISAALPVAAGLIYVWLLAKKAASSSSG